jgi:D-3-phosphoglycerate dehydrogenase
MTASASSRIVLTSPIDQVGVDILEQAAPVDTAAAPDEATLLQLMPNAIGLVVRGEGRATAAIIDAAPKLAVIGRPGAGYDTVDIAAATARKIPVVYAPIGGFAVAEGALALLLALVKMLPRCDRIVRAGEWNERYNFATGDISGHTMGIIGLGRIGLGLARLLQPFGATLLGYDPHVDPTTLAGVDIELVELDDLMARSDYLSLHPLLNDATRGLINRERLALMRPGSILVNLSRGGVIDSLDTLANALDEGTLAGVGLDVFPTEPPDVTHPIFSDPRCLFAPHILGASALAMDRICRSMAADMVSVIDGQRPEHCVNPEVFD